MQEHVARLSAQLRRCASAGGGLHPGRQLHARAVYLGLLPHRTLETDLVLLYARCGALDLARRVFDAMPLRSMHANNILLAAYAAASRFAPALALLRRLLSDGVRLDRFTLPPALKASAVAGDAALGSALHGTAARLGFGLNPVVQGSILDMYAKCGSLGDALKLFDEMPERDAVVWNCMVCGLARAEALGLALEFFQRSRIEGFSIDLSSVPILLNLCGKEGELRKGLEIHAMVIRHLAFDSDLAVSNALIDMYGKCGRLTAARNAFDMMKQQNIVTWSVLISTYGIHGRGQEMLQIFEDMVSQGVKPNGITFTLVLAGCSHSGLVAEGRRIFDSMQTIHNVEPGPEHYTCMVDLLGRSGRLEDAVEVVRQMPMLPCASVWGALLGACAALKNVTFGEIAAFRLFELEESNPSNYVALCGIYEAAGDLDAVAGVRLRMRELGMSKTPGCSLVDVKGRLCPFYQGSFPRRLRHCMLAVLTGLLRHMTSPLF